MNFYRVWQSINAVLLQESLLLSIINRIKKGNLAVSSMISDKNEHVIFKEKWFFCFVFLMSAIYIFAFGFIFYDFLIQH